MITSIPRKHSHMQENRQNGLWVDDPPPERNLKLGIGKHIAQQTIIHREAVKKALEKAK